MSECIFLDTEDRIRPRISVDGKSINLARIILEKKLGRPLRTRHIACHTCNIKACVNPEHLYEGTYGSNAADSYDAGRITFNGSKTHCKYGHEYTKENTRLYKGGRWCRKCATEYSREYMRKRRRKL